MPKRFTATELWDEDWFIEMPIDYKLFFFFLKDKCDHSGIFKVNVKIFNALHHTNIDSETAFELINKGKKRLRKVNGSMWFIEDFIKFQYGKLRNNNGAHNSVIKTLEKHQIVSSEFMATDEEILLNKNRMIIYYSYNKKCLYCNKELYINNFVIDHIKAKKNGGSDERENLALSCQTCNTKKKDLELDKFCKIQGLDIKNIKECIKGALMYV